jgi:hypothetical protein
MLPRLASSAYAVLLTSCVAALALTGCSQKGSERTDFQMGEKIPLGSLTYNIVQTSWRTQLGEGFKVRFPQNRFLQMDISVTNGGSSDVSIPLLTLDNASGQSYTELANGDGVDNWLGLLRTINPGQTEQGRIVFDVPLTSYKLHLTDGGGPGAEKLASVTIPLHMDIDTSVPSAAPGAPVK